MAADKRGTLFTVGERLFSQNGYRDVSVEDIARAAGLGTGSFYSFFRTKEELYAAILDGLEKRGAEEAERHVRKFNSPLNKLKALFRFSVLGLERNPLIRGMITGDKKFLFPGAEKRGARGNLLLASIERLLDEILAEGARKRVFRTGLFQNPHRMLLAAYNAILLDPANGPLPELMNDMLLLIERGIKRRLRLRQRDERLDRRLMRRSRGEGLASTP
jgi:AcrR family transcriptional regulator